MVTASGLLLTDKGIEYHYTPCSAVLDYQHESPGRLQRRDNFSMKVSPHFALPRLATDIRKAGKPFEPCVGIDKASKILVLCLSFGRVQIQRIEDCLGHFRLVCRMERNTTIRHEGSRAGKFGENEDTMTLLLAGDILEGHEVHSITSGGEKTNIGYRVQRGQFVEWNGAMHIQQRSALGSGWLVSMLPIFAHKVLPCFPLIFPAIVHSSVSRS